MSNDKILFIDDDINILNGFKRNFYGQYLVEIAEGPLPGLEAIKRENFSVVISDKNMPDIDGIALLSQIKQISPNTTRILLTGQADLDSALRAVNEGAIFRFLTKPAPKEVLTLAIDAGIRQNQLLLAEKELLENTLRKTIKVLIDILSQVSPTAFNHASRVYRLVKVMAEQLDMPNRWELEIACLLSQIGCVTVPEQAIKDHYENKKISPDESKLIETQHEFGFKLIHQIPRLEKVAEIIRNQTTPYSQLSEIDNQISAVHLIKLASDYDALMMSNLQDQIYVLNQLEKREENGHYHHKAMKVLKNILNIHTAKKTILIDDLKKLKPGMITAQDVLSMSGRLLLSNRQEISEIILMRLKNVTEYVDPFKVYEE